ASGNTTVNLISGEHCVTVTDAIGCTTSKCFPITNKEYSISVTTTGAASEGWVHVKKEGFSKKIKLSEWLANQEYYEKLYGKLPPPPPPPAPPKAPKDEA
ncbi:MAG: hypothetical protein KTQ13_11330, partial [Ferruginibacter sp.]|nr:hypothetical protein [Ferruginibacter sp.]